MHIRLNIGLRGMIAAIVIASMGGEAALAQPTNEEEDAQAAAGDVQSGRIEEITVTAERRMESIQDLPTAISAFSGETLIDRGVTDIEDLQKLAPSLHAGDRYTTTTLTMRGITGGSGGPGVGITEDGVPYHSSLMASLDFFDVDRVEVLRGPQGTISGRNTTGGVIHFYSKRPTEDIEGGLKATIGNYDRLAIEGYLSGPVIEDRLLGRLAVRSDRADGWVTNTLRGEKDGDTDLRQVRASLLAHLTENVEAHLILEGVRHGRTPVSVDVGRVRPDQPSLNEFLGIPEFDPNTRTFQDPEPGGTDLEKYRTTLNLAWDLGPSAQLVATTGYVDLDFFTTRDLSAGFAVPFDPPEFFVMEVRQLSQEVTLTADLTDRLDMLVGGLFLTSNDTQDVTLGLPLLGIPPGTLEFLTENDLTTWGGYTQWRYRLTDDIRLTAGLRYTHDSKERRELGRPIREDSWDDWTPRVAMEFTPTDDSSVYVNVARGFSAGGFGFSENNFDPEIVWNYEAGVKANLLDRRLRMALTAFYMDYTNLQITVLGIGDPEVDAVLGRSRTNADTTISGAELELDAFLTDQFRITFGATWLKDAHFNNFFAHDATFPELGDPGPVGLNVRDLSGNRLPRAPKSQFNVSGEYRMPLALLGGDLEGVLRASYFWRDKIFFTHFNHDTVMQDAYGLLSLSAAIESGDDKWQLSAYGNNLTDKLYWTGSPGPLAIGPVPVFTARLGPPRTYGVSLAYRF